MPAITGKYIVKDSKVYVDNGHGIVPILTFCASLGIKPGDDVRFNVTKATKDKRTGNWWYFEKE